MPVVRLSQALILISDSHTQIESGLGGIDSSIESTKTETDQFVTNRSLGVDASVEEAVKLAGDLKDHGGSGVN
jgi:hypothetical protein